MGNTYSTDLEKTSSQYWKITDGDQSGLDIIGDISLEAWVKIESAPSDTSYMIMSKFDVDNDASFMFRYQDIEGTKKIRFFVFNSAHGGEWYNIDYDLGTATWVHIAVTWDASASTAKFYINGSQVGGDQVGSLTDMKNSVADFRVGARADGVLYFDGKIDEVRVWNDTRTITEIADNMSIELIGDEAGLVGYWQFNNNGLDLTSNNNDLTNINVATFSTDVPFADIVFIPSVLIYSIILCLIKLATLFSF